MITCEYSDAERKLFRHFGTEELCQWFWPHQLYRETAIKAFREPGFNACYEEALRTALLFVDDIDKAKRVYRLTPEFDKAINFWMDKEKD